MTNLSRSIAVKPIIKYPREAQVGKTYLMTIDLQPEDGFEWQYEEEEYPVYCSVDSNLFSSKPVGEPVIVLHRFGRSYGEAKFLLETIQQEATNGEIEVALINRWGVLANLLKITDIEIKNSIKQENHVEGGATLYPKSASQQSQIFAQEEYTKFSEVVEKPHQTYSNTTVIDLEDFWFQVLERLQPLLISSTFENWIKNSTLEQLDQNCLVIRAPSTFARDWLRKYYLQTISDVIQDILGYSVEIQIIELQTDDLEDTSKSAQQWWPHVSTISNLKPTSSVERDSQYMFNPKYVFSRFIVGSSNRVAHAASLTVAEFPGGKFNPLFLYGGDGLGKTHLMQAIAHYRQELDPNARLLYISTEQFTNNLIAAIRKDDMESFRDCYRTADLLLIDDIQFIEGKQYTQEEFFHTFNTLHASGMQIVISSDCHPRQIPRLVERLRSRFSMGLIAEITPPDLETRLAILQKMAGDENISLSHKIIEQIAFNYPSNIREMEGALIRAAAYISASAKPMTVEDIISLLDTAIEQVEASPDDIITEIIQEFNISVEDLKGSSRKREHSSARQTGMYLMHQLTKLSLLEIGEIFGGKSSTTVIRSCKKISKLKETDIKLADRLRRLSDRISFASGSKARQI